MTQQLNTPSNRGSKAASGVKEVQWTAFTSQPSFETDTNGFGSFNDFFTDSPADQTGNGAKLVTSQQNVVGDSLHMVQKVN